MPRKQTFPWIDPRIVAAQINHTATHMAFFYSGAPSNFTGEYSLLAWNAQQIISADDFEAFSTQLSCNKAPLDNAWFGYLGYELKNTLETLPHDLPASINPPPLYMIQYQYVLLFNHQTHSVELWNNDETVPDILLSQKESPTSPFIPSVATLNSNMTKADYLAHVQRIKNAIAKGDLYQANLTRKFYGTFDTDIDHFALFTTLCQHSPSPYSAYLKHQDLYIISSSPERFLQLSANGKAEIRPIKGSAPRHTDPKKDQQHYEHLQQSPKDRAENLMIVDLSRNDLSRQCTLGSVTVPQLFEVTSYATVHHMSSTIIGQKLPSSSALSLVQGCFPPGSMTGAPKIKAMQLCSEIEQQQRGIYAGTLGWFGGDGSVDLSVVIRTLIIENNRFEFQVGGAIIADSDPEKEWEETMIKARALIQTLGLPLQALKDL